MPTPGVPAYRSFLLRCWEECDERGERRVWRFSLEDSRTRQRRGFASLAELAAALAVETTPDAPPAHKGDGWGQAGHG